MVRESTVRRVHHAVLELAVLGGPAALTMEGIAAHAGVSKQTLYRAWTSVTAILFDALLARDVDQDQNSLVTGDLERDIASLLRASIDEISTQPHEALLRSLAARIQADEDTAAEFHDRLFRPQLDVIHALLRDGGATDVERTAELLLSPIFYRWFMRLPPMSGPDVASHVRRVLHCAG